MISNLLNFFRITVRQSIRFIRLTIYKIKKAIGAVLFEYSEPSNKDIQHQMFPRETESLCKYQTNYQTNIATYKGKSGLPVAIRKLIRGIFMDLSNDDLLKICLQNDSNRIQGIEIKATKTKAFVNYTKRFCGCC